MSASHENYRIFAIKYAHHHRLTRDNFLGGDPHDGPMPIDYFVWAIVGTTRTIMVDTGFDAAMAHQRGRTITHCIEDGLSQLGIDAGKIEDVIISHMHYDHAGNHGLFPNARFHLQDREMAFCTGRCMGHHGLSQAFDVEDVKAMVGRLFAGRLQFHHGDAEIAPGISVHRVGGHTDGLQIIRVHTARGWWCWHRMPRISTLIFSNAGLIQSFITLAMSWKATTHFIAGPIHSTILFPDMIRWCCNVTQRARRKRPHGSLRLMLPPSLSGREMYFSRTD